MNQNKKNNRIDEMDEEEEVIVLVDESTGKEVEFSLLAMLEVDGKTYAYLEPIEEIEGFEDGDLLINEVRTDENGEESFLPIDDDEIIDKAFAAFDEMYAKEFGIHCDGSKVEED